jgi:uroporphyrinogen III methyltransferase/synthase
VAEELRKQDIEGKSLLLPRAEVARDFLPEAIEKMGGTIDVVSAYRTVKAGIDINNLKNLLREEKVDVITFTSPSTVSNFWELLGEREASLFLKDVTIAAIGPVTAKKAVEMGKEVAIIPRDYTVPALTEAIVKYFKTLPHIN